MDGFIHLLRDLLMEAGCAESTIFIKKKMDIPGYYRPTKRWDLLVVDRGKLLAVVETKSHVGSFGNNANNRAEEAVGNAADLWRAYKEGKFQKLPRPWLGFLMLLEESDKSTRPTRPKEPHFAVFPEFQGASYQRRYEILCEKLVQERLYDATCLLVSEQSRGRSRGEFTEPSPELTVERFARALVSYVTANR